MLPPGHIAGGYLAGKLLALAIPSLDQPQHLLLVSFFGFAPDLDSFFSFYQTKKWVSDDSVSHRRYITHAPLLYLLIFVILYLAFPTAQLVAWTFILGTWSHFFLDSFQGNGIMWLYPFSDQKFSLVTIPNFVINEKRFFKCWWIFTKQYLTLWLSKLEILIILIAIITFFIK